MESNPPARNRLDLYLPNFQWKTYHSLVSTADRQVCFDALVNERIQSPLVRLLVRLRGMNTGGSLRDFFEQNGFTLLEEDAPGFLVFGMICRPWRIGGSRITMKETKEWFSTPSQDHAMLVTAMGTMSEAMGRTILYTETRIKIEDEELQKRFAVYWFVVKPFSGLIRRSWLGRAKRIAEQRGAKQRASVL